MSQNTQQLPVAVVTGGTSGIGLAIARALLHDHLVYVVGRRPVEEGSDDHSSMIQVSLDIRDNRALSEFVDTLPRLDVLVHSAAVARAYRVSSSPVVVSQQHFSFNLFSPAHLTPLELQNLRVSRSQITFFNSCSGSYSLACCTSFFVFSFLFFMKENEKKITCKTKSILDIQNYFIHT